MTATQAEVSQATEATKVTEAPTAESTPTEAPQLTSADLTLQILEEELIPENDPSDLVQRLGGKSEIPATDPDPDAPYDVGAAKTFWVTNVVTNANFQVDTTLAYADDILYIWVENNVEYHQASVDRLGSEFSEQIYPTNRAFFGSEWTPGIDNDPHIYFLFTGGVGGTILGYFSSADEIPKEAHPYSNAHEMFILNADNLNLSGEQIRSTLAHEFQHMIHWNVDRNEDTWLNEGFSMLAELLNDLPVGNHDTTYIHNPDIQITSWGEPGESNIPHYGASFLFTAYLLDRFGEEVTQAIVESPLNGMESIDHVLQELAIIDPLTGETPTAEDIFADWVVANLLGEKSLALGRYAYGVYPNAPLASPNPIITGCPSGKLNYDVRQYGVDYIGIQCKGEWTLNFTGNTEVGILPIDAYSGDYFFWSNMGDSSDMSLQQSFDLTNVEAPVEMTFQAWYDLEVDYDYVFVSATTDGENWQILDTSSCTTRNPSGNSYGCGLNGVSNGWKLQAVDLSAYAGKEVTLRFDYITDAAVNGVGLAIDDIQIAAIDYSSDLEADEGGWQADGFVRIENVLPQSFRVTLITYGDEINVIPLELNADNTLSTDLNLTDDIYQAVLVISGTTPVTRQSATYQVELVNQGE
ncbi:MAG: immune inhibitor A [Anaerolineaceae bacterium]|nr:immune inhibitor A [Anaerolineaceae bacterium]